MVILTYRPGDRVLLRTWEELVRRYGECNRNDGREILIPEPVNRFIGSSRKPFLGRVVTIKRVVDLGYEIFEDDGIYDWYEPLIAGYVFAYGEQVEVCKDPCDGWVDRLYVGFIDGTKFPYVCVAAGDEDAFLAGKEFGIEMFRMARPCNTGEKRALKIVIDGEEVEVSAQSYYNIKNALGILK